MTQCVVKVARAGEKYGSVEISPFSDRDTLDATILVSRDDAYFIDALLTGKTVTPMSPANALYALVKYLGGRFSEVGVGPQTGTLRIVLMGGEAVGLSVHPGFALQIALIGELPIFYGEDEESEEAEAEEAEQPAQQTSEEVRARLIEALAKLNMRVRTD